VPLLLLSLLSYTYSYHDWLNLPAMTDIVSVTTDNFDSYVAVPGGVYEISVTDGKLVRTITHADGIRGEVRAVGYDSQFGMLWILSSENLLNISPFSNQWFSYDLPDVDVNSLGITRDYVLLSTGSRYWQVQKQTGITDETQPGNRSIAWFGAKSPHRATDYPFLTPYLLYDRQLRPHRITLVYPSGHRLWVGTEGFGVFLYNLSSKQLQKHWQFGPAGEISRIFRMPDGLWFSGDEELARFDPARDSWSYFSTPFNVVLTDPALLLRTKILDLSWHEAILTATGDSNALWLGTDQGIYSYRAKSNVLTRQFRINGNVNDILIAADSVFLATDGGFIAFDRARGTWSIFNDTAQQMHFGVFGIGATSLRRYYAVYGGLETQDSTGNWEMILPPGFDLATHPHALAGAGNRLFVATSQGVMVYNETTGGWLTLNTDSGLPDRRVQSLYADDNALWVVTPAGISRFDYHALFP
jgi:hypothetical protein